MGNEANCTARVGKKKSTGKALLETSELLFRGDLHLKIPFSTIRSAKAVDGELRIQASDGTAIFELGALEEKWLEKILHPKSRLDKLGVKTGASVSLLGNFETDFVHELRERIVAITDYKVGGSDSIFISAVATKDLAHVAKVARIMKGATALWVVYPKGQRTITENDVLTAGRMAGLKDVKVVGFSSTHTGLKFVIPVSKR